MVSIIFAKNILFCTKHISMTLISIRDFRSNQGKYLGLAAAGESVILTSRKGNFKIVPVTEDDSLISKRDFLARLENARKSIESGKSTTITNSEDLTAFLESL